MEVAEGEELLRVEELTVEVDGRRILRGVDLTIRGGETHVLFGPNGSGKSSLLMAIVGLSRYRITSGSIHFRGENVTRLPADERARRGIGMVYQRPPTVRGVSLRQLADRCAEGRFALVTDLAHELGCLSLLSRDVHAGFSGGEIKKAELLQVMAQRPALALIDEPDAGVDLDNVGLVGEAIARLVHGPPASGGAASALIITHTGHILNYVRADVGHVLYGGRLVGEADGYRLLDEIRKHGYGKCPICRAQVQLS